MCLRLSVRLRRRIRSTIPIGDTVGRSGRKEDAMPPHRLPLDELLGEERALRRQVATLVRRRRVEAAEQAEPRPVRLFDQALIASLDQHNEAIWKRLEDKSHGLSEVRARLQEGAYGICRACGCRIPRRRLQAMPAATLCVPCQAERE
jgi:RNA polymerase-binding transcription factor DksA